MSNYCLAFVVVVSQLGVIHCVKWCDEVPLATQIARKQRPWLCAVPLWRCIIMTWFFFASHTWVCVWAADTTFNFTHTQHTRTEQTHFFASSLRFQFWRITLSAILHAHMFSMLFGCLYSSAQFLRFASFIVILFFFSMLCSWHFSLFLSYHLSSPHIFKW